MADESLNGDNGGAVLDAQVKGRVPRAFVHAIEKDVRQRRKQFPRASRSDVLRDALTEYFANHPIKLAKNGKSPKSQRRELANA